MRHSFLELRMVPGLGEKSLKAIIRTLHKFGLQLDGAISVEELEHKRIWL